MPLRPAGAGRVGCPGNQGGQRALEVAGRLALPRLRRHSAARARGRTARTAAGARSRRRGPGPTGDRRTKTTPAQPSIRVATASGADRVAHELGCLRAAPPRSSWPAGPGRGGTMGCAPSDARMVGTNGGGAGARRTSANGGVRTRPRIHRGPPPRNVRRDSCRGRQPPGPRVPRAGGERRRGRQRVHPATDAGPTAAVVRRPGALAGC